MALSGEVLDRDAVRFNAPFHESAGCAVVGTAEKLERGGDTERCPDRRHQLVSIQDACFVATATREVRGVDAVLIELLADVAVWAVMWREIHVLQHFPDAVGMRRRFGKQLSWVGTAFPFRQGFFVKV
ncbi:hypothetical protein [Streptomyces sp. NPDC002164]|uniref:hypothetical protein n=1 Tax=Streptomyces sp. NPDC002164 TaxID=3364633 RepID=UPI00369CE9DC